MINFILLVISLFLGYKIYNAVYAPVKFNKIKVKRYQKVVDRLKDIRDAELAHIDVTGDYTGTFDSLVKFIDTAKFVITQRRDSSYKYFDKAYGIEKVKDTVVIDTLGFASVKDSLFKGDDRYKDMMWVPIPGKDKQVQFELKHGYLRRSNVKIPVFVARVDKAEVLYDQDPDLVAQEKNIKSTKEINGPYIQVGSLDEVTDSGNWPKLYDIGDSKKQ
ncbi:MAG TPA: hypothetical protein ENK64_03675 [Flavobacteriales bacterium]|nr:hypothetical protein [Flavobacteriales bacterium]